MKRIIAPSVLSANFLNLGDDIKMLEESQAEWIHFDVMDGVFVPNISFGIPIASQVSKSTSMFIDAHLMIIDPNPYLKPFKNAGVDSITVHYETLKDHDATIQAIKDLGIKVGMCVSPDTPVEVLQPYLERIDMVLIMSVYPGFGGQTFIEATYKKVTTIRKMIDDKGTDTLIQVDGGVNLETGKKLFGCGANVLVAGSFVFGDDNPKKQIENLLTL